MEDLLGTIAIFAFFIISALIKGLRKKGGVQAPQPPPPRAPGRPAGGAPAPQVDLEFLKDTLQSLGIDAPEELQQQAQLQQQQPPPPPKAQLAPAPPPAPVVPDHPDHDIHPRRLGAAAYEVAAAKVAVSQPKADSEWRTVSQGDRFFAELDDVWDHQSGTRVDRKAELFRDALIVQSFFARPKRH